MKPIRSEKRTWKIDRTSFKKWRPSELWKIMTIGDWIVVAAAFLLALGLGRQYNANKIEQLEMQIGEMERLNKDLIQDIVQLRTRITSKKTDSNEVKTYSGNSITNSNGDNNNVIGDKNIIK